jgi:hypothetical protein
MFDKTHPLLWSSQPLDRKALVRRKYSLTFLEPKNFLLIEKVAMVRKPIIEANPNTGQALPTSTRG